MLASVAATAYHPERLEVVLVIDADDLASRATHPRLDVRHVVVEPGSTMGALNPAGYDASRGDHVMLPERRRHRPHPRGGTRSRRPRSPGSRTRSRWST
jgi:hypothetical protein